MQPEQRQPIVAKDLHGFFLPMVGRHLQQAGLTGEKRAAYVAGVLAYFADCGNLLDPYRRVAQRPGEIRERGRREPFLYPADVIGRARETGGTEKFALTLHGGEYALFMASIFEAFLAQKGITEMWMNTGQASYDDLWLMSRENASLFKAMADDFPEIVSALRKMRDEELRIDVATDADFQYLLMPRDLAPEEIRYRALDAYNRWKLTKDANAMDEARGWWKRLDWDLGIFARHSSPRAPSA